MIALYLFLTMTAYRPLSKSLTTVKKKKLHLAGYTGQRTPSWRMLTVCLRCPSMGFVVWWGCGWNTTAVSLSRAKKFFLSLLRVQARDWVVPLIIKSGIGLVPWTVFVCFSDALAASLLRKIGLCSWLREFKGLRLHHPLTLEFIPDQSRAYVARSAQLSAGRRLGPPIASRWAGDSSDKLASTLQTARRAGSLHV